MWVLMSDICIIFLVCFWFILSGLIVCSGVGIGRRSEHHVHRHHVHSSEFFLCPSTGQVQCLFMFPSSSSAFSE